jgi:hypothetical protein
MIDARPVRNAPTTVAALGAIQDQLGHGDNSDLLSHRYTKMLTCSVFLLS